VNAANYLYLHGFASSPTSAKAQYLRQLFSERQIPLAIPDLNQGDFSHLTLSRQLQQAASLLPAAPTPITVIGSSFGGLAAAWLGEKHQQVERLVLLAPAFGFLSHWLDNLGTETVRNWQESGYLSVYHYGDGRSLPLHYQFVTDLHNYQEEQLQRSLPTLILHGRYDEVIPVDCSRDYARQRPWVELIELESNHGLTDVLPEIWQAIEGFCH
jgi:pimeloyl-ACP methyl ester carboxylesterase